MNKTSMLGLALLALLAGSAVAQDDLVLPPEEPTEPSGWWMSIMAGGRYCNLRNFPPIPNGEGPARLLCGQKYNQEFIFNVRKVGVNGPGGWNISSGDEVYLRNFNPLLSWCNLASKVIQCGVVYKRATPFVIERADGGSGIDIFTDAVLFKAPGSGNRYCRVKGRGNSAYVYCDAGKGAATAFRFPANSYHNVSLTNGLSKKACGGVFIGYDNSPNYVNCTVPYGPVSNFPTGFSFTYKQPGQPLLRAGVSITLKHYDELYHYQMAAWAARDSDAGVSLLWNKGTSKRQWFTLEKISGSSGDVIADGDVLALKSDHLKRYCGITAIPQQFVTCNVDPSTPLASLTSGYRFTFKKDPTLA